MTTQRVALSGGWIGLRGLVNSNEGAAKTISTDLINILDTVDVPIVVVRRDFRVACFNQAASDVLGLVSSDVGRSFRDISVLADVPHLEEQCTQVIAGGMESRADFRHADKWFVIRISRSTNGDHLDTGAVLTFTNVTAFRASIDQAIYERECTKAVLNTVADPLVVLSADQRIQSGNRAFYTLFGVSRHDTHGLPLYELGNGAFELARLRTQLEEMFGSRHAFRPIEVDHVLTRTGQRTLILDARPLALPGHSERRVLVTFQDITTRKRTEAAERKQAQEKLRQSEAFLAEAQHLSRIGSFSWRVAADEITWSEQLYHIFELDPTAPFTLDLIRTRLHPENLATLQDVIDRARREGGDFDYESRLLMPDGSVKYIHLVAHGGRNQDGELELIGAVQDITERRRSEEALSRARTELAHVARVTTLGALTASIAHEVNQPLSGIITNASTCLRMLDADPPNVDGARETARRIIRDGNRASEVITRLRALFNNQERPAEPVDLNEAAREVMALSSSELRKNGVRVRPELAEDLPPVLGDRVQLQQVILNLLLNASDAMNQVDGRARDLVIRTELEEGERVRLMVKDVGVGIEPQAATQVFEPFYTTKRNGMGIGLSVCRSIIECHQGRLWTEPNNGPGATFSFSLPRGSERPAATPVSTGRARPAPADPRQPMMTS